MVNLPSFLTCLPAMSANAPNTFEHSDFFNSHAVANWSAISVFEMDLAPFIGRIAFIAFIAFMDFIGAMAKRGTEMTNECSTTML